MVDSDRQKFYELVSSVYVFYRQDCSPFALGVWWETCKQFDLNTIHDALNRHAANPDNGQFLPKPADVIKLIAGGTLDAAMVAWSVVDRAVRSVGPYQTVTFDDPITMAVLRDMGGWIALGQCADEEWPFKAKEFENRYRGYRLRGRVDDVPKKLIGIADAENIPAGRGETNTVLIGCRQSTQLAAIEDNRGRAA